MKHPPDRSACETITDLAVVMIPLPDRGQTQEWRMQKKKKNDNSTSAWASASLAERMPGAPKMRRAVLSLCMHRKVSNLGA